MGKLASLAHRAAEVLAALAHRSKGRGVRSLRSRVGQRAVLAAVAAVSALSPTGETRPQALSPTREAHPLAISPRREAHPAALGPSPSSLHKALGPTASDSRPTATGTIRGHVDVRVPARAADLRPDPGGMGISGTHDPVDRRRSVAYLEAAPRSAFEVGDERRGSMNQRHERFVPHVLAIVAGTWVDFPNGDATYHNVFSLSKAKAFNLGRYAVGQTKAVRFERPGVVRVFCEIHSHMSAFILVFAHRYFAVTDEAGRYRIDGVPPGGYTVMTWNESAPLDSQRVVVPDAGGEVELNVSLRRR